MGSTVLPIVLFGEALEVAERTVRRVSEHELRRIFNDGPYCERIENGEWLAAVERDSPARPEANQPPGTRSQMVWYYDSSLAKVALVHQYLLLDGRLGGSGRPDPKRLLLEDEILYV